MSIGIYKITNKINNKCYIGQSVHVERRWTEHCLPSSNSLIANAIKKYGKENFNFEILENCFIEELNDLEEYYIQQYNTITPFGYNVLSYQEGRITVNNIGIDVLNAIFDDIKNSKEPFINIARKYNLSTRTIIRINLGQTHYNTNYSYPLRSKVESSICPICGERKTSKATVCMDCYKKQFNLDTHPNREELKHLIRTSNFVAIGKQYNVSDNAVRKWCKKYNLPFKSTEIKKMTDEEWQLI